MDKYEIRRINLIRLIEDRCGGVDAKFAKLIGKDASYIARCKYPPNKIGKKRISDAIIEPTLKAFSLPHGWMDVDHSKEVSNQTSMEAAPSALNPKQQALLGYFNGLTESQQEEVMRELQEKKQQNDNLLLELLERKANHK